MLKRMSPSEASDPPIPIPAVVAGTSSQLPAVETPATQPELLAPQLADLDVAIDPEAELEPPVATLSKAKTSSKKINKINI